MKALLFVFLLFGCNYTYPDKKASLQINYHSADDVDKETEAKRLRKFSAGAKKWCRLHRYNVFFFFVADMSLPSGRNRFFIYDMQFDSVVYSSLVSHGCCNRTFLQTVHFSNQNGCGCSSVGKYKIGGKYKGKYGTAYKLFGLDTSNSNAWERNIVLHSYHSVPDAETYPNPIVNSYGCPMVSKRCFQVLERKIDSSRVPILLWVVN